MNIGPGAKLQFVLDAVPASQPKLYVAWLETSRGGEEGPYKENQRYQPLLGNGTTDVDLIAAVPEGRCARVQLLNVFNTNATAINATLKLDESGTETILWRGSISSERGVELLDDRPGIADAQLGGAIVLDDADLLEVNLQAAHATTAPRVYVSWSESPREQGPNQVERHHIRRRHRTIQTNATTPVELVPATDAVRTFRRVDAIMICNTDTATISMSVRIDRAGTKYQLRRFELQPGENASFSSSSGWLIPQGTGSGAGSDSVVSETSFGLTPNAGTSSNFSRADHTHGTPAAAAPAAHAATHKNGGSDELLLHELGEPTGAVDFNQQEALRLRLENRTSDPASPAEGQIWLRTDL